MAAVTARVGVFGGAFDPPHLGHVELARAGEERFALERLLVRVVEDPGHKSVSTPAAVRLRLAELAFASVAVAEVAVDAFGRTVDSLEALALPDPVFLVGADEFASFLEWKEPARVLELARLGVATRPGVEPLPVSSSEIRRRGAAGDPLDGLVPAPVAAEIARLGLYRAVETAQGGGMLGTEPSERTTPT